MIKDYNMKVLFVTMVLISVLLKILKI